MIVLWTGYWAEDYSRQRHASTRTCWFTLAVQRTKPSLTRWVFSFSFSPSLNLRAIVKDNEPWFIAADVCRALDMDLSSGAAKWSCQQSGRTVGTSRFKPMFTVAYALCRIYTGAYKETARLILNCGVVGQGKWGCYMTNWTQKELDVLAAALQRHLSVAPWDNQYSYLLVDARKRAHAASELPIPCEKTLSEVRPAVCRVCREQHLYVCDVPNGWSSNCELLRQNS